MNARLLALSALSLAPLLAGTAHAQAPGEQLEPAEAAEVEAAPVQFAAPAPVPQNAAPIVMAPAMVPMVAAPAACTCALVAPRESVMANRWSVGLSFGSMSLTPDGSSDSTNFGVGELALRFRLTPHLELEGSVGGGREQLKNGDQGDLEVTTFAAALRYRFNPEGAWNWFAMGGIGAAAVTLHDATDQQRNDATHPMAMLGVGVERRFRHFALQAELRGIGIGEKKTDDEMAQVATMPGSTPPTAITSAANVKQSGGELTIGASWYF